MDRDEIPASPEAISICAPYGNNPWIMHENVSRMLAVLRGSRPKRVVMSFAIRPVVNGDSVRIVAHFVGLIDVEKAQTKRYNVVLRGFKQVVNARSMRDRLIKEGHNSYVLYYEKEKLYYVIIEAFDTREGAADFLHNVKSRVKMNVPLDNLWILEKIN